MVHEKENHPPRTEDKPAGRWSARLAVPLALVAGLAFGVGGMLLWQKARLGSSPIPTAKQQTSSSASQPARLASWYVFIKPEYILPDMPHEAEPGARKVLVDYQGQSAMPAGRPVPLAFHIPSGGGVGMTCAIDAEGRHYMASPEVTTGTPYDTVQFLSTKEGFHMGLTYPAPAQKSGEQVFEYPIVPLHPVEEMGVVVQQPPLAQNFRVEYENVPSIIYSKDEKEGFTYHRYRLAAVDPGQKMLFRVRYTLPAAATSGPVELSSKELPAYAYNSAISLKSYRVAQRIPDVLYVMPCYCGCDGAAEHKNLRDCFINAVKGEYDSHASGCDLCSEIAIDVDNLIQDHSLKETRTLIEKKYGDYGRGTPTPPIGS